MKRLFSALLPVLFLGGCSTSMPDLVAKIDPFKIDVRQGNYVTQEMVAQLKPGQTKEQVRFILGTPLIQDIFHADRWDYVYRLQPGHGDVQQRRLIVFFQDSHLVRVAGDVVAGDTSEVPTKPPMQMLEIESSGAKPAAPSELKPALPADTPASAETAPAATADK